MGGRPKREGIYVFWASQVALVVKNPPADAGDIRDLGSIPGWRRSPGGEYGNPFQYSCLENPMDREAWQAIVIGHKESDMTEATEHAACITDSLCCTAETNTAM